MKRRVFTVFVLLALCLSLATTAACAENLVYDHADLLNDREEAKLSEMLHSVSQENNAQVVVATVAVTEGGDADDYVEHFYDSLALGYGADRDGVLMLVCMDIREYRILSNGYASAAISPDIIDRISDIIVSDLSEGEYYNAFDEFAYQTGYYLNGYRNGFPFNVFYNLVVSAAIGAVVGLVVVLILRAQLRSVHRKHLANFYIKNNSLHITTHQDTYLYRNVTRREIEVSSSSSSGSRSRSSSGRSIGGGKF